MDTIFLEKLKNSIDFSKFDRVLLNLASFPGFKHENCHEDSINVEEMCKYLRILLKFAKKISVYFPETMEIREFPHIFEHVLGENK